MGSNLRSHGVSVAPATITQTVPDLRLVGNRSSIRPQGIRSANCLAQQLLTAQSFRTASLSFRSGSLIRLLTAHERVKIDNCVTRLSSWTMVKLTAARTGRHCVESETALYALPSRYLGDFNRDCKA
jgi:hypothetical protein